ncbi:MAG: biotin/lipoyl-containing protein [Elusimicrobiaceae bacterium]
MKKTEKKSPETVEKEPQGTAVLDEIKTLYGFMQKNSLETIDYESGLTHIKLVRKRPNAMPVPVLQQATAQTAAAPAAAQAPAEYSGDTINSPLQGIFFRAASPSSPPFVREGDSVKKGQVLCLIESMKVFNEVKAEFDCTINKVLTENGKPVKSGEKIFAIQK